MRLTRVNIYYLLFILNVGINNAFGLSAPAEKIYEHFGFGVDNLTARANEVIAFYTPLGKKNKEHILDCVLNHSIFQIIITIYFLFLFFAFNRREASYGPLSNGQTCLANHRSAPPRLNSSKHTSYIYCLTSLFAVILNTVIA